MEAQMLKDKVAIITGASYGMGRTMAELFAEEGAAVVITARHAEQLDEVVDGIRAKGGRAVGVVADVCSTEDTERVFKTAIEEFGDLDILINNAGIGEQKIIDETDDEWMLYVMNTNLGGLHYQHQLRERHAAILRRYVHLHQGRGEHAHEERGDAAHRHEHTLQRCGPGRYRDTGAPRQPRGRAAGRGEDARLERALCVLPRPGVRPD